MSPLSPCLPGTLPHQVSLIHISPSVRGSGDDLPTAAPTRPQRSIFAAQRQVAHSSQYPQYPPSYS